MTSAEQSAYKQYLFKMTDDQLDVETSTVIRQDSPDKAMLIQFVYTEWLNRGKGERFVKAYNNGVGFHGARVGRLWELDEMGPPPCTNRSLACHARNGNSCMNLVQCYPIKADQRV